MMRKHLAIVVTAMFLIAGVPLMANAYWINLTGAQSAPNIAEIHVNGDHIKLVLEVYVKDSGKFIDLLPNDFLKRAGIEPPPIQERMKRFSKDGFQFLTDDKKRLYAELKLIEPRMRKDRPNPFAGMINPSTMKPVPGPPEDKRVLYTELVYPFESKIDKLTIIPPLGKGDIGETRILI